MAEALGVMNNVLPIDAFDAQSLRGEWRLAIDGPEPLQTTLRLYARPLLAPWIALCKQGGCTTGHGATGTSDMVLLSRLDDFASGADLVCNSHALDPRALHVLRSALLAQVAPHLIAGLDAMEDEQAVAALATTLQGCRFVAWQAEQPHPELQRLAGADPCDPDQEYEHYPDLHDAGLHRIVAIAESGKLRRCVVEFVDPVDAALLLTLRGWIGPWIDLLELGGFEQPCPLPGIGSSHFGAIQLFDAHAAEIVVDCYEADEGAWKILVNLLNEFARIHPLSCVELH